MSWVFIGFSDSGITGKFDENSKQKKLGLQNIVYQGKHFLFVPEENKIAFFKQFI